MTTSTTTAESRRRWLWDWRNLLIVLLCAAWLFEQFHLQFLNSAQLNGFYGLGTVRSGTSQTALSSDGDDDNTENGKEKNEEEEETSQQEVETDGDAAVEETHDNASSVLRASTTPRMTGPIPSWRVITDCSVYATDCPSRLINRYGFQPYPFDFFDDRKHTLVEWEGMPTGWKEALTSSTPDWNTPYKPDYVYKPEKSPEEVASCMERHTKTLSYEEQLKEVLQTIQRNEELQMVAFTISDITYAKHQIHDFFEMSADKVEFRDAAFMVALDEDTIELGCKYDYPVIASSGVLESESELRSRVQSTKFEVSRDILKNGVSFLFYEMDIYWLRSPVSLLKDHEDADIIVSSHFDNPWAPNIGIYMGRATEAGLEFFEICLDLQLQSPKTHDQVVFARVRDFVRREYRGETHPSWNQLIEKFEDAQPEEPQLKNKIKTYELDTLLVSAIVHVQTNEHTLAVHPLCGAPLRTPHGKMMMAKEVGAWYGFQGPDGEAGYYKRKDEHRRYLLIDGRAFGGFSNTQNLDRRWGYYHDANTVKWTISLLVVLARRLDRILILPNIHADYSNALLWWVFDTQTIEDVVDYRETNFPSNPKAWATEDTPFNSVARTALLHHIDERGWRMFSQYNDGDVKAWDMPNNDPLMEWVGLMLADEEVSNAEALFVNPAFINREDSYNVFCRPAREKRKATVVVGEVVDMLHEKTKWCGDPIWRDRSPAKMMAETDCYGNGKSSPKLC